MSLLRRLILDLLYTDVIHQMIICVSVKGDGWNQPQLPEPQEPLLQPPPPPRGLAEVIPKPDLGPASINSTLIAPQVSSSPCSMRNLSPLFSKILSLSFGSSRANPSEGPDHPPCIRATRRAESRLFCSMYSLSFDTARSVTVKSDMNPPCDRTCCDLSIVVEINYIQRAAVLTT
jgi:hypothetical protein